ncbi:MAG: alginate lyase family protein [Bacillota bacterium]
MGYQKINLAYFKYHKAPFFMTDTSSISVSLKAILRTEQIVRLMEEAENALTGNIRCFSSQYADYGQPIDWNRNPRRGVSWPRQVHWSRALAFERQGGDCKLVWEINRFPHFFSFMRAYLLTGDPRWVRAFADQLTSWEEANPFNAGINWNSGQEVAIRVMVWVFGLFAILEEKAFEDQDFQRLMRMLYLHGRHLAANINFARLAVPNNHLIGEALGLYLLGSYFPWMKGAAQWKKIGRELLEGECLIQFYADGGYCQSSHNYHRLALHYYIWAVRTAECLGEPFPPQIYNTLAKSAEYLATFMNWNDGRLPNWGANDGALLCPWTSCDYADFRPVLNSLHYLTTGKKAFKTGLWDEELLWLWGTEALSAKIEPFPPPKMASFPVSGLYLYRDGPGDFLSFRCGSLRDRFGQADQLHIDLWWSGLNVAQDGGSYLYNEEHSFHRYFMGTRSHNTVTVDAEDQMILHRRFRWLNPVKAGNVEFITNDRFSVLAGEHYGYNRLPGKVLHRRKMFFLKSGVYVIVDYMNQVGNESHSYNLHWLLGSWNTSLTRKDGWNIINQHTPAGDYELRLASFDGDCTHILDCELSLEKGLDGDFLKGWWSRYYGERMPAWAINSLCRSAETVHFVSAFYPSTEKVEIWSEHKKLWVNMNSEAVCLLL